MKTTHFEGGLWSRCFCALRQCFAVAIIVLASIVVCPGQGTIVFDGQVDPHGTNYYESGMWFRVIVKPGDYDSMGIIPPNTYNNFATNSTPYIAFAQLLNPNDYVIFSLTNGSMFGLASAYLGDPWAPSPSAVLITFLGFKTDGSTVTNTFTTPGNGANSLLNYQFTSDFASGLTSVKIDAPRWAMDNLVFTVPEPSAVSLVLVGGGIFGYVRTRKRHSARK